MYFDPYYLILVIPATLIAIFAQIMVSRTYNKFATKYSSRGMTAYEVARQILDQNGLSNVQIIRVSGKLTDHFDPRTNIVALSEAVYGSTSIASIGVAAHEVGHAVQYQTGYVPIKIRAALIPITQFGSTIAIPMAILGIIFGFGILVDIGIILFSAVVAFQLITLPVEFNASNRAIKTLEQNMILQDDEIGGAKKVLGAAALTYVAGLLVSIANLARLLLLRGRNDN